MSAFLYGLVSAASLPIGAIVGIALSPVRLRSPRLRLPRPVPKSFCFADLRKRALQ